MQQGQNLQQQQQQQSQNQQEQQQQFFQLPLLPVLDPIQLQQRIDLWRGNAIIEYLLQLHPTLYTDQNKLALRQFIRNDPNVVALSHAVVYAVMQSNSGIDRELYEYAFSYFFDELIDEDSQRQYVCDGICDFEWKDSFGGGPNTHDQISRHSFLSAILYFVDVWVGNELDVASYCDWLMRMYNLLMQHNVVGNVNQQQQQQQQNMMMVMNNSNIATTATPMPLQGQQQQQQQQPSGSQTIVLSSPNQQDQKQ